MIYKSYKFSHDNGSEIKVRFYFTGIYTIVDKNGEHEMGLWQKTPLLVGKYLKPSKDKSCVLYSAKPFGQHINHSDYALKNVALQIARHSVRTQQITL